jgi:glycosyltransferase involved in cell wall biosynthesis
VITVFIAVYNEARTLAEAVDDVRQVMRAEGHEYRIVILNDGSTDWSDELERGITAPGDTTVHHLYPNGGKGAALDFLFPRLEGEIFVSTDADLEYPAREIPKLLRELETGACDHVMGSRYGFGRPRPRQYWLTYLANWMLNLAFFLVSGKRLRDMMTGMFAGRSRFLRGIRLREARFSFVPEMYWKLVHQGVRFAEVPVEYRFRGYSKGKKIKWYELFTNFVSMVRYRRPEAVLPAPAEPAVRAEPCPSPARHGKAGG